jgi:hypothetical protein
LHRNEEQLVQFANAINRFSELTESLSAPSQNSTRLRDDVINAIERIARRMQTTIAVHGLMQPATVNICIDQLGQIIQVMRNPDLDGNTSNEILRHISVDYSAAPACTSAPEVPVEVPVEAPGAGAEVAAA